MQPCMSSQAPMRCFNGGEPSMREQPGVHEACMHARARMNTGATTVAPPHHTAPPPHATTADIRTTPHTSRMSGGRSHWPMQDTGGVPSTNTPAPASLAPGTGAAIGSCPSTTQPQPK